MIKYKNGGNFSIKLNFTFKLSCTINARSSSHLNRSSYTLEKLNNPATNIIEIILIEASKTLIQELLNNPLQWFF